MTQQQSKWNADAEAAMMGFVIPVESDEHLKHLTGYVLYTLKDICDFSDENMDKLTEVLNNAQNKYNSSKDKSIKWFTVNSTAFGTCLTFVRDKSKLTLKDGRHTAMGSLAWVENIEYPDCSELGYVFFEKRNGKVRRVA